MATNRNADAQKHTQALYKHPGRRALSSESLLCVTTVRFVSGVVILAQIRRLAGYGQKQTLNSVPDHTSGNDLRMHR